jgi:ATP-dependent RNA helicase RhlE
MLDMGFMPAIERIVKQLPGRRQTLLFSATFSDSIRKLGGRFLRDPLTVEVARRNAASETVSQSAYLVDHARKRDLLAHLIHSQDWQQVLVFTRTKHGADRLAKQLDQAGIEAVAIHGDKTQGARTRALADFKGMRVRALVATDVAARGLDIDNLPHVVNYDLPHNPEDYVHRIGRTGRAGQKGAAISLCCPDERAQFQAIKRLVKLDIPATTVSGYEPQSQRGGGATQRPAASHHAQSAHRRHHASAGGVAHAHTDPRRDPQDPFQRRRDAAPQARHAPQRPAKPRRHASKDRAVIV